MHADNIYLQSKDNPQLAPNAERVAELKHHAVELYKLHRMKQTKGRIGRDPDEVQSLLQAASRCAGESGKGSSPPPRRSGSTRGVSEPEFPWRPGPDRPLVLYVRALVMSLDKDGKASSSARPLLEEALKLDPGLLGAWLLLSHTCWEAGDTRQALACASRGLAFACADEEEAEASKDDKGVGKGVNEDQGTEKTSKAADTGVEKTTLDVAEGDSKTESPLVNDQSEAHINSSEGSDRLPSEGSVPLPSLISLEAVDRRPLVTPFLGGASPKEALQQLSMLVRQQQQVLQHSQKQAEQYPHPQINSSSILSSETTGGTEGVAGYLCEEASSRETLHRVLQLSRDLAAAALEMDLEDAYSWYVLALAQLSSYLQAPVQLPGTSAARPKTLIQLLGSFHQAERRGLSDLADLYYNRAALHTYCQSFSEALSDYKRAAQLDRTLPVGAQVDSLVGLLSQVSKLVAANGDIKPKQWGRVTALLAKDEVKARELLSLGLLHYQPGLLLGGLSELNPGDNRGTVLICRPLVFLAPPLNASATLYLVSVDSRGKCFALALVRVSHSAFDMDQVLTVINPELINVSVPHGSKTLSFPLIRVDASDSTLLVDGVPVSQEVPEGGGGAQMLAFS